MEHCTIQLQLLTAACDLTILGQCPSGSTRSVASLGCQKHFRFPLNANNNFEDTHLFIYTHTSDILT